MIGIFGLFQKFQKFWLFWFWFLQKFLVLKTQRIFEKFSDIERPESLKDRENRKAEFFSQRIAFLGIILIRKI